MVEELQKEIASLQQIRDTLQESLDRAEKENKRLQGVILALAPYKTAYYTLIQKG